jgi:hypothetical protein
MATLDQNEILGEVVVSLRNANILTTTQRGVTTTTQTGTVNAASLTIGVDNVKNIRTITVGSTALVFGSDYLVDYDYNNTCLVSFSVTQTGSYTATYDFGSDRIFAGYPRNDLTISSFPRIAVDFIDISSETGGFGNVNLNRYDVSVVNYAPKKEDVRSTSKAIRSWCITNQNSLFYLRLIKPTLQGPVVVGNFEAFKNKMFQQNLDFRSILNLEIL